MVKSIIFNNNLYFIKQEIKKTQENSVNVVQKVNHILVLDVSYSMYDSISKIKRQISNKISNLVREGDTVSIIYFSGKSKNESGILKEQVEIKTLKDLSDFNQSLDKYLKVIGMTGFVNPLQLVKEVIERISSNPARKDSQYSMLFLTDGYDNQSSEGDILKATKELESLLSSVTFVEYGYYANRRLLTKMAETLGANLIFSEGFEQYDPVFESVISKNITSTKKISVKLEYNVKNNFVFVIGDDNTIVTYKTDENNEVLVGDDVTELFYLTENVNLAKQVCNNFDHQSSLDELKPLYTMLYLLSQRGLSTDIYSMLAVMGEVYITNSFINAFGKKDTSKFQQILLDTISDKIEPYLKGYNTNIIPNENAYCILNLLEDLMNCEDSEEDDDTNVNVNLWYPKHESFSYNKIGVTKVQTSSVLLDSDIETIKMLSENLTKTKDLTKIKELQAEIAKITESKFELKFEYKDETKGSPITGLVFNSNRPNVSVPVKSLGKVKLPENEFGFGITEIDTFRFNNYTIIRDGIVNFDTLPVSLTLKTFNKLKKENLINDHENYINGHIYLLNLRQLPVINRSMVKSVSAKELLTMDFELTKVKSSQKIFNYYEKLHFPKVSKSFIEKYGVEVTNYLEQLGITDSNGFSPKVTSGEKGNDVYPAVFMEIKVKGLSQLPSINDVNKKLADKKPLTISQELIYNAMVEYNSFIESPIYLENENKEELLEVWLKNKKKFIVSKTRQLMTQISKIKFGIILGQVWFNDLESIEDTKMKLTLDGKEIEFEIVLEDKEIEI